MIDINMVCENVKLMGGYDDDIITSYLPFIESAISSVESLLKEKRFSRDLRVVNFAAAKAYYAIACAFDGNGGITSFKAGDVSISESTDFLYHAKELLTLAKADCSSLINDNNFAFLGV